MEPVPQETKSFTFGTTPVKLICTRLPDVYPVELTARDFRDLLAVIRTAGEIPMADILQVRYAPGTVGRIPEPEELGMKTAMALPLSCMLPILAALTCQHPDANQLDDDTVENAESLRTGILQTIGIEEV